MPVKLQRHLTYKTRLSEVHRILAWAMTAPLSSIGGDYRSQELTALSERVLFWLELARSLGSVIISSSMGLF